MIYNFGKRKIYLQKKIKLILSLLLLFHLKYLKLYRYNQAPLKYLSLNDHGILLIDLLLN